MVGVGIQGGSLARANAYNNDMIQVTPMQMGRGGTEIGDVGPGTIHQTPSAYIGGSTMDQHAKLDIGLLNLQAYPQLGTAPQP